MVDVQIALGLDFEINEGMARQLLQHMVEEAHAGLDLEFSRTVEIKGDADARFGSGARQRGLAHVLGVPANSGAVLAGGASAIQGGSSLLFPRPRAYMKPIFQQVRAHERAGTDAADMAWHD